MSLDLNELPYLSDPWNWKIGPENQNPEENSTAYLLCHGSEIISTIVEYHDRKADDRVLRFDQEDPGEVYSYQRLDDAAEWAIVTSRFGGLL